MFPCAKAAFYSRLIWVSAFVICVSLSVLNAAGQETDKGKQDKNLDVRSSAGDLHTGEDADARSAGLPLYPGARRRHDEQDSDSLNFGILTEAFGMKLVVAKYDSDDAPAKLVDFYREKLRNTARCSNAIPANIVATSTRTCTTTRNSAQKNSNAKATTAVRSQN